MQYQLVCNLRKYSATVMLPEFYLANVNAAQQLDYLNKRVTAITIANYPSVQKDYQNILDTAEALQLDYLEEKFSKNPKKKNSLEDLMKIEAIKNLLLTHFDKNIHQLLLQMQKQQIPLVLNVSKDHSITDCLCHFESEVLLPNLFFKKEQEGMTYQLRLWCRDKLLTLSQEAMLPLTNEPAWVLWKNKIMQVAHINGKMLKPFLDKDLVFVRKSMVKEYFEKFILKIATKVHLETEGFEVVTHRALDTPILDMEENFMDKSLGISLRFKYQNAHFAWYQKQQKHTRLAFQDEEVTVHLTIRDLGAEGRLLQIVKELGLEVGSGNLFQLPPSENQNPYSLIEWLITHKKQLESAGFSVKLPNIQNKIIALDPFFTNLSAQANNDWFDIHGEVTVGETIIPFAKLFPYIKQQNPFYPLENGTFFIIPATWMNRFLGLASHGKKSGQQVQLHKSLFTVLNELDDIKIVTPMGESTAETIEYQPSSRLKAQLRPYQLEGVKWLIQHYLQGFGACLADDMGLGKTLQTIATLLYIKENSILPTLPTQEKQATQLNIFDQSYENDHYQGLKALIILPASLVFNWEKELKTFAPHLIILKYIGSKRKLHQKLLTRFDVVLTTYQTALKDKEILTKYHFQCIVLDESQHIKNKSSQVFKAIDELQATFKISLSGTPIENSLSDLWAQMQFINPNLLSSFSFFQSHFITPIQKQGDELKKAELRNIVQPFLLRRTKAEVAKDLPPLSMQIFFSEMSDRQSDLYEREKSAIRNHLLDNFQASNFTYQSLVLQSLTKLRLLANHPILSIPNFEGNSGKYDDVLHQLDIIRKSGHKVLIFSNFTKYLALFEQHFIEQHFSYCKLTGKDSLDQRKRTIDQFQNDDAISAFLISMKAGGTGLNLTAADYVYILDPWWNPNVEEQAIARAHRIGQTMPVFATKFIAKDSIEEKILTLQEFKRQLAADIMATSGELNFRRDDIEYLLN